MTVNYWDQLTPEEQAASRVAWDEAMADPEFVEGMERAKADLAAGRTYKWSDIKAGRCGERHRRDRNRTCQRRSRHEGRHRYSVKETE